MTKIIIGVCLLVIGGSFFLSEVYSSIKYFTSTREELKQQVRSYTDWPEHGIYMSDEKVDKEVDEIRKWHVIGTPIAMLVGISIAYGGFVLFKRGRKDKKLTETFKFD